MASEKQILTQRRAALLRDLSMVKGTLSRIEREIGTLKIDRTLSSSIYNVETSWMDNARNLLDHLDTKLRSQWGWKSREQKAEEWTAKLLARSERVRLQWQETRENLNFEEETPNE